MGLTRQKRMARTHPRGYSANRANAGTVRPQAGWREVGDKKIYFRSRWEANYARYLEWLRKVGQIALWEHEPATFWFEGIRRGCVSYLPDFKVGNLDGTAEYHEVKGWLDPKSKTKLKRMAKYYPNIRLRLIGKSEYKSIQRKIACVIPGWEAGST